MKLLNALILGTSLLATSALAQSSGMGQGDTQPDRATMPPRSGAGTPSAQERRNDLIIQGQGSRDMDAGNQQSNASTMPPAITGSTRRPGMTTELMNQPAHKNENSGAQ